MARFTRANTPLLEPVLAFMAGIIIAEQSNKLPLYLPIAIILVGLAILALSHRLFKKKINLQPLIVSTLFCFLGFGLILLHQADTTLARKHDRERLIFLARIDEIPLLKGRWQQATTTVFCYKDTIRKEWIPIRDTRIRLYADTSARNPALDIGDIIEFRGRLFAADTTGYDLYMRRTRGITARCYTWNITRLDNDPTSATRIETLRSDLCKRLNISDQDSIFDRSSSGIMQALAIGNQSEIDRDLRQSYSRTGVAHLLSVSGLHVGIIFLILNLLLSWIRLFRNGSVIVGILVILLLCGYAILTGLSPSVLRAVVMFSLLQIGLMLSRYTNNFNTLCAAALMLLLWNPYYLYHIGFQLSFAAMVGIITLYRPIATLWTPKYNIIRWLYSLTLVGITAQIGTFPLILYHFGQLQIAGILLNPVIWFTVPVIIVGSLLYLVSSWEWIFRITSQVTEWQNDLINWMASHRWVAVEGIETPWWICAGIYLIIILLIVIVNRQSSQKNRSHFLRSVDRPLAERLEK